MTVSRLVVWLVLCVRSTAKIGHGLPLLIVQLVFEKCNQLQNQSCNNTTDCKPVMRLHDCSCLNDLITYYRTRMPATGHATAVWLCKTCVQLPATLITNSSIEHVQRPICDWSLILIMRLPWSPWTHDQLHNFSAIGCLTGRNMIARQVWLGSKAQLLVQLRQHSLRQTSPAPREVQWDRSDTESVLGRL